MSTVLKNKPLQEAIFEIKWELLNNNDMLIDPNYELLIGRLYDKLQEDYPIYEKLPTANIPHELAPYIVQHRFRKYVNGWPLIQVGPGIITMNFTSEYVWDKFQQSMVKLVKTIFDISKTIKISSLQLRYIDAIEFDYTKEDIFDFLKQKMKTGIEIPTQLFEHTQVNDIPLNFDLKVTFESKKPIGLVQLGFSRGIVKEKDALIWNTMVQSPGASVFISAEHITSWAEYAHELTDDWFFKIIEGELERRFE